MHRKIFPIYPLFLAVFFSILAGNAVANSSSHRQAAAELLEATQTSKTIDNYANQIEQSFSAIPTHPQMTTRQLELTRYHQQRILEVLKQNFNWNRIKEDFITVYTNVYSEKELKGLTHFYQSELGKAMLEKTPLLMQQSMQITQMHLQRIAPELQKMTEEMMAQLQNTTN